MTASQMRAMLTMHEKAAAAYRQHGKIKDAETAEKMAADLREKIAKQAE